ncbi:MAG: OsmC family protein [Nitrospiraceae bacterium]|nr:MAG: OsmC family protein [Nitrospiraceae bacterium]
MTEQKFVNGVDIGKVENTVKAIQEKHDIANFRFRLNNKWINGGHNQSTISSFYGANQENSHLQTFHLDADEPPALAGEDKGANPVEHLLNALAACLTTTLVYHAAIRDIKLEELESELEGDIDLRGFLGLSKDVRKGYENIRVTFKVKTEEKNIEKLKALSKLSPVFDVTTKGTNVDVQIERK